MATMRLKIARLKYQSAASSLECPANRSACCFVSSPWVQKKSSVVKKWFTSSKRLDNEIRERFEGDLIKARQGEYKDWEKAFLEVIPQRKFNAIGKKTKQEENDNINTKFEGSEDSLCENNIKSYDK